MNYIRHLNAFFSLVRSDNRLTSSHVSLYLALFHYWNFNRFNNPFSIYRENIMQLSKLSKNTYHKCIKELHEAQYIYYHPSLSKFQAVRISIIRLDKEEGQQTRFKQLDMFTNSEASGLNIETGTVANLTPNSPNIKTGTVANLGHFLKPNINKQRETPTQKIFEKNKKINDAINTPTFRGDETYVAAVSNLGHDTERSPSAVIMLSEVEVYFKNQNYPNEEAIKFYNHYKALGWKIQGKTPIADWKPLAEKWMTNAKKWESTTEPKFVGLQSKGKANEIQYLYDCFLENKQIFHQITEDHFTQLNLIVTEEIEKQAWQQRINQLAGSNQYSLGQLWQAYLRNDPNNPLLQQDKPNLLLLSKRIAVIKHFQQLKSKQP